MNAGIIGNGVIAQELKAQLKKEGIQVAFTYHYSDTSTYDDVLCEHVPDIVFLAISTKDTGEAARGYILETVSREIPIITCEKGAHAYHADALREYAHLIGVSASAGGGSMLLGYARLRQLHQTLVDIQAILNGTINFIFFTLEQGSDLAEACRGAGTRGYLEPGATEPLAVVNSELKDVMLKICVFYNLVLSPKHTLKPEQLQWVSLTEQDLEALELHDKPLRLVVTFSNTHKGHSLVGTKKTILFAVQKEWTIRVSFQETDSLGSWLPRGAGNMLLINEGPNGAYGEHLVLGPGAGPEPTAHAMVNDCKRFYGK